MPAVTRFSGGSNVKFHEFDEAHPSFPKPGAGDKPAPLKLKSRASSVSRSRDCQCSATGTFITT
ncbi:hypothetical protein NL54_13415 [Pantoea stewartii]|nr:hypothetical protein NL54_13415 [Pantoea stewartii]KHN59486.1 hypothetical protein OI73_20930 [Pantoea stewartii]